ncbi:MAG: single-stranded DNA-binding protein [Solobacterium sp.]|jgi:single stranded DNA-binding protein|nr:single-stranded DNA-binding protein [Solobacterium sp.]
MGSQNNRWIGEGRLGKDPQYRSGQGKNGGTWEMCNFSIACEREDEDKVQDKDGSMRSKVDWIDVKAWGQLANQSSYYHKGDTIHVEGRLEHNDWTGSDGVKHYGMLIEADTILDGDATTSAPETRRGESHDVRKEYKEEEVKNQVAEENNIDPDELPF